jgi:hypothetical protein
MASALMAALLANFASQHARAEPVFTAVALEGEQAPGLATGVTFTSFEDPQLDDDGRVLFFANVIGPGITNNVNDTGLWIGPADTPRLILRHGDAAPGFPTGTTFEFLGPPILGRNGGAGFYARLDGPGISDDAFGDGNDDTLWSVRADVLPVLERGIVTIIDIFIQVLATIFSSEREICIGYYSMTSGEFLYLSPKPGLVGHEKAGVKGDLVPKGQSCDGGAMVSPKRSRSTAAATGERQTAFVLVTSTTRSVVAAVGEPAPGTSDELVALGSVRMALGDGGVDQVVFRGSIASGSGVWLGPTDAPLPIVLPGAPVPASLEDVLGAGATFGGVAFGDVAINTAGEVAFSQAIAASGENLRSTIVAGAPNDLRVVARERASGAEEGFIDFTGDLVLNAAGDVAFIATDSSLAGLPGFPRALWMTHEKGEPFSPLAEGRTAPGLEPDEVVTFFEDGPYMNAAGQVLVRAGIGDEAGVQNTEFDAFWLIDPVAGAELVVREGGTIELDGETRTVASAALLTAFTETRSGGEDGRPSLLNNDGSFVLFGSFERDGGGFEDAIVLASVSDDAGVCGDANTDASVTASDALAVLLTAVGLDTCELCVCDLDQSGTVSATDALVTLQAAVGIPDVTLECPAC